MEIKGIITEGIMVIEKSKAEDKGKPLDDEPNNLYRNKISLWITLTNTQNAFKIHNYFLEHSLPFTPEFIALF